MCLAIEIRSNLTYLLIMNNKTCFIEYHICSQLNHSRFLTVEQNITIVNAFLCNCNVSTLIDP